MSKRSPDFEATTHAPSGWVGPGLLLAGGVGIGLAPIGLRLGLDDLGPFAIAFWRFAFAAPLLFVILCVVKRRLPRPPNGFIVLAGVCHALNMAVWHWGLTLTTVANATFISNMGYVAVGLTAWIFLSLRPGRVWAMAASVAVLGALILSQGGEGGGKADLRGDFLALCSGVFVSFYIVAASVARRTLEALDAVFWLTVVEVGVGALVVLAAGEPFLPDRVEGFAAPLFLAVVSHVAGQGLILAGLGRTAPAIAGVMLLVQPVVAAAISWRLFDEPLTGLQISGAVLILIGVFLAQRGPSDKKASQLALRSGVD